MYVHVLALACLGAALVIAAIVVVAALSKKKKEPSSIVPDVRGGSTQPGEQDAHPDRCVNMSGNIPYIWLRNESDSKQVWEVPLVQQITIGRDQESQVYVPDKSVSRPHCRIIVDEVAKVENLSTTNTTKLNGVTVSKPAVLGVGDKLKCGRVTLIVDALCNPDQGSAADLNDTALINV